jgi:hypothetical protein
MCGPRKETGRGIGAQVDLFRLGVQLQPYFGNINTDRTDLNGLRDSGHNVNRRRKLALTHF